MLTNCDSIEFQFGDFPPKRLFPDRETYPHLPHAPVIIDSRSVDFAEIGAWGMRWQDGRFTGYVAGKAVAEVRLSGNPIASGLQVEADDLVLLAAEKDSSRIVVRALDQLGNVMPVFDDVVNIRVDGPARLLGPDAIAFRAGVCAFWVETTGEGEKIGNIGTIVVTVRTRRLGEQRIELQVN